VEFNLFAIRLLHSIVNKNSSYYSVSVSVCTIKGTESRLLELGRVAEISGGQVYNVTLCWSLDKCCAFFFTYVTTCILGEHS